MQREYVNFGKGGVMVTRMALGLGFRGQHDADEAKKTISTALDGGLNLIDCANIYGLGDDRRRAGTSEIILGELMQDRGDRDDIVITSKVSSPVAQGDQRSQHLPLAHHARSRTLSQTSCRPTASTYTSSTTSTRPSDTKSERASTGRPRPRRQDSLHRRLQLPSLASRPNPARSRPHQRRKPHHRPKPLQHAQPRTRRRDVPHDSHHRPRHHGLQPPRGRATLRRLRSRSNAQQHVAYGATADPTPSTASSAAQPPT